MELTEKTENESHSVVFESLNHMDYTVHGILQARILEWVALPFSRDVPNPGIEPRSPAYRQFLYQLSYQGNTKDI